MKYEGQTMCKHKKKSKNNINLTTNDVINTTVSNKEKRK